MRFVVARHGNDMGSRGSAISLFKSIQESTVIPITTARMTRFIISLDQGGELARRAFDDMVGGEIYAKKIPSMKVTDVARTIAPDVKGEIVGIRLGEKLQEQMIGTKDSCFTYEYPEYFKILPQINCWADDAKRIKDGVMVLEGFICASDSNPVWMSDADLQGCIDANVDSIGKL